MVLAASSMHAIRHFDLEDRDTLLKMIKYEKNALTVIIAEADWLSLSTKVEALKKLNHMKEIIGFTHAVFDEQKLDLVYKGLELHDDDYFGNILSLRKHFSNYYSQKLR